VLANTTSERTIYSSVNVNNFGSLELSSHMKHRVEEVNIITEHCKSA
jgi:hypothetical protein